MEQKTPAHFSEEQRFRQPLIWLLIGFVALLQWNGFIQQILLGRPRGDRPAPDWFVVLFWLLFGIGLPLFFLYLRLVVTVTGESVDIHFHPLTRRTIPMAEITHFEARTYSPLREYGGWGIRGFGSNRAYNVSGDRGVELTLKDGRKVMVGSQRADDLARAIAAAQDSRF
jgi:hypothetical protein